MLRLTMMIMICWVIFLWLRDIPSLRYHRKDIIPQQLVVLVRQAQAGKPFITEWDILVDVGMREKLCYPLTADQVEIIKSTIYQPQESKFEYVLSSYAFNAHELSGTVLVTIRYRDKWNGLDLDFKNIPIRIRCTCKPFDRWKLSSVEYL